jgi:hypothetical protein
MKVLDCRHLSLCSGESHSNQLEPVRAVVKAYLDSLSYKSSSYSTPLETAIFEKRRNMASLLREMDPDASPKPENKACLWVKNYYGVQFFASP